MVEPAFVVKICGVTNEADARAALEAGANALGFNFYQKSPRHMTPSRARAVAATEDCLRVGVFVNATAEELLRVAEKARLDVLQLHGEECEVPDGSGYRIWRSVRGDGPTPEADSRVEAYLLDTATPAFGGSGRVFDWSLAKGFPYRAIVAGGLDGGNVAEAIAALEPWGVDACSRIESRPGKKDVERMRAFVRAALEASELLRSQEISSL
jgi:phosphoribosylanthranilate isomerase